MISPLMLRSLVAFLFVIFLCRASAGVQVSGESANTDAAYGADVSNSDLVNAGASTLTSPPTYGSAPYFGPTANNDGTVGTAGATADITFWLSAIAGQQFTITYALDTSLNTLGYDITSIQTIHGWTNGGGNQKNQNYTVAVSTVGSATFADIATVAYLPFGSATNTASSRVNITEDVTGILASNVDEIRFTYTVPASGGPQPSPTIREIDVFGMPTTDGPDTAPPMPNPMSFAVSPYASSSASIAMEASPAIDSSGVEYFFAETSGNPGADDSTWQSSRIYEDDGLTSGLEYTYTVTARDLSVNHNSTAPSAPGSARAGVSFPAPTITTPTSRQIVQRSDNNFGAIVIEGTYLGSAPDQIDARVVVMPGAGNSGTETAWQTIDDAPAGGGFSGTLTGVPAGGWYQLEVRGVTGGSPGKVAEVGKIGVGDIYVTCGQSNAANFGSPAAIVADDRVSAWDYSNGAWTKAADPMPGAKGAGGSVWTRLGDLLALRENVPIAFACLAVGGTRVSQWEPSGEHYPRVSAAMHAFPIKGFRGVLWHQGESDSLVSTTPADYQSRFESMVAQSRIDAGWAVPWFIAEVGFHPNSNLAQEEPVVAGQRNATFNDQLVFPGPVTDDFHLEGKVSDGVHFNNTGLADHAAQWAAVLGGVPFLAPKNADFEANTALADGAAAVINTSAASSPSVIGWRALAASGETVADGSCGYFNPDNSTYLGTNDSGGNGGVIPNMSGKHVAFLSGSGAGSNFLQTRRAMAEASRTYTLTVAIGVRGGRNDPADFGGVRLEILSNGQVVASANFDKAAIDGLRGGNSAGTFTDASVSWAAGSRVASGQALAIRIIKSNGAGTVLDFDNVRLTDLPTISFNSWISNPNFGIDPAKRGFEDDPDLDGIANGLEAWFGTNPGQFNSGLTGLDHNGFISTFTHPQNDDPLTDVVGFYRWSPNLVDWYGSGSGPGTGPVVTLEPVTIGTSTTVTATASEALERLFLRAEVMQK